MRGIAALPALAALFMASSACSSQDTDNRPASRPARFEYGLADGNNEVLYLIDHVRIRLDDRDLRCDAAVVWFAKEEKPIDPEALKPETRRAAVEIGLGRRIIEIYAEGHVHLSQKEEVTECEAVFFDLVHERGIVVDPRVRFNVPTEKEPIHLIISADELRVLSQVQSELIGARISSCPFGNPHYHVASEKVDLYRARAAQRGQNRPSDEEPATLYYTATDNSLYSGSSFPIMWIPDFSGNTSNRRLIPYLKAATIGSSSQFGRHLGVKLGDDLTSKDHTKWGSWDVDLDWLSKRGAGVGVDFGYVQTCTKGDIKVAYQRDKGTDLFYGPPPSKNRWRLSYQHRTYLTPDFQLDLEANFFSDRGYYPTFFESEFKGDKPPETYAYMKRAFRDSAVTGLVSVRTNDWETMTEFHPKFTYDLVTDPLVQIGDDPLYLTARAELSHMQLLTDKDLHVGGVQTWRADLDTLLEYPFLLGSVKMTPFAGLRETYYQYVIAQDPDQTRTGFTYGGEASMQLSRNYGCVGGFFDLDGLRHVIRPSLTYRRTTGVDLRPNELHFFDAADTFDDTETITMEVRNLFQTVRHRKGQPATTDEILDVDLEMNYYPDPRGLNGGRVWGNLMADAILRFSDSLQFVTDFQWNPNTNDLEDFNVAVGYAPSPKFQAYTGYRHFDDLYDLVYAQANYRLSEKWLLRGYASYDLHTNLAAENDLYITRIGHDWAFSLVLHADYLQDDFSVNIALEPRVLFDAVLKPPGLRREPEFQYLGTQIHK